MNQNPTDNSLDNIIFHFWFNVRLPWLWTITTIKHFPQTFLVRLSSNRFFIFIQQNAPDLKAVIYRPLFSGLFISVQLDIDLDSLRATSEKANDLFEPSQDACFKFRVYSWKIYSMITPRCNMRTFLCWFWEEIWKTVWQIWEINQCFNQSWEFVFIGRWKRDQICLNVY